jgi:hypothetical protein
VWHHRISVLLNLHFREEQWELPEVLFAHSVAWKALETGLRCHTQTGGQRSGGSCAEPTRGGCTATGS